MGRMLTERNEVADLFQQLSGLTCVQRLEIIATRFDCVDMRLCLARTFDQADGVWIRLLRISKLRLGQLADQAFQIGGLTVKESTAHRVAVLRVKDAYSELFSCSCYGVQVDEVIR